MEMLGPGDDLWVLVENTSAFFLRVDWLCNFQISQQLAKTPTEIPAVLKNLMSVCKLPSYDFADEVLDPSILVDTSLSLPARGVLYSPVAKMQDKNSWSMLFTKIRKLNVKSSRIFLPHGTKISEDVTRVAKELSVHFYQLNEIHMREAWTWS